MTKQTERFEQPEIDRVIEAERQPNHEVPEPNRYSFVVRDVLEVTPVVQQGFDSLGLYITRENGYEV